MLLTLKTDKTALGGGVAQRVERPPTKPKVTGSVPVQGTRVDSGPGPQLGAWKRQLIRVCLPH